MTEQENKAIKWMQNVRDDAAVTLDHIAKEEPNVSPMLYAGRKEKAETIIKGFEELEKYRDLEQKLNGVDLMMLVNHWMEMAAEGEVQGYQRGRVLTNEDADQWDAYKEIGTPEECRAAVEKQKVNKELESHDEKRILESCIALMQEMVNEFSEWYRWQHGENAIEELDEEERFCIRKTYFRIVQELFLLGTNHSGGTSTRAKCKQLGVDWGEEIEFNWSDEE